MSAAGAEGAEGAEGFDTVRASREVSAGKTHKLVEDAPFLWEPPPAAERVASDDADADGSSSSEERIVDGAAFVTWKNVEVIALAEFDDVTRDVRDGSRMPRTF